jgi:hypothetical protein
LPDAPAFDLGFGSGFPPVDARQQVEAKTKLVQAMGERLRDGLSDEVSRGLRSVSGQVAVEEAPNGLSRCAEEDRGDALPCGASPAERSEEQRKGRLADLDGNCRATDDDLRSDAEDVV